MSPLPASETCRAARALGGRLAAAGALAVALVALLRGASLGLASLLGAGTLVLLAGSARLGTAALARALDSARTPIQPKKDG
ncbi:MAG TPA: hypothetical protein VF530_23510 [Planctomycetota bacterium]